MGLVLKERVCLLVAGVATSLVLPAAAMAVDPPSITITTPVDEAEFLVGEVVNADYACSDAEGAITLCEGTADGTSVADDALLPTAAHGVGLTFAVDAEDDQGDVNADDVTYSVLVARCADVPDAEVSRNGKVAVAADCEGTWDSVHVTSPPDKGTVEVDPDTDELVYTAPGDYTGTTTFKYHVRNDAEAYDTAARTVTVTVGPCADTATAVYSDVQWPVSVDCGTLDPGETIEIGTDAANGTAVSDGTGVQYTSGPGYVGEDTFTFFLRDGGGDSVEATATITVSPLPPFGGGGGDGGGGGASSGGGGSGGASGLQPDEPDPPAEGLPPIPFLPSLGGAGGVTNGNIPTAFGTTTAVSVPRDKIRAKRRGTFTLPLRNDNRFTVTGTVKVTGAYRKNRKGKRVPRLRARNLELMLPAGNTTKVTLGLSRKAQKLLERKRKLSVVAELKVQDVERTRRTVRERFTLRAAPKQKPKRERKKKRG